MAWERRGSRTYLYRKRREGRRVVSEYCGTGDDAVLLAALWMVDRDKREANQYERRAERERLDALDRAMKELDEAADIAARAALVIAGYRQHNRGHWRRARVRR
jgi:hypothetical protein